MWTTRFLFRCYARRGCLFRAAFDFLSSQQMCGLLAVPTAEKHFLHGHIECFNFDRVFCLHLTCFRGALSVIRFMVVWQITCLAIMAFKYALVVTFAVECTFFRFILHRRGGSLAFWCRQRYRGRTCHSLGIGLGHDYIFSREATWLYGSKSL